MQQKVVNKRELILTSQDPLQFCFRITTEIQHDLDPSFLVNLNPDRIRRYFFVGTGWRLTRTGCETLAQNYMCYTSSSEFNKFITGKLILNMDNCVGGPWCISGQNVTVFNPGIHFELQMVSGNVNKFVDFKSGTY